MDKALIGSFLRETSLENSARGTWGLGKVVARAGAKVGMSLTSLNEATDELLISSPLNIVQPIVSSLLKSMAREMKNPVEFGAPNAQFCMLTGRQLLNRWSHPSIVFVYLKSVSEGSTHFHIECYSNDYGGITANAEIKMILKEFSLRFR